MITTLDIEQAEAAEAKVRERAEHLRRTHGMDDNGSVERARRQAAELRRGKERQDQALTARAAVEKGHGVELKRLGKEADASAAKVAAAAVEARGALLRLVEAVGAHNEAVQAVHARLEALGLPIGDEACSAYETGAGAGGVVCLAGRSYGPVGPDVLLAEVVGALGKEVFGPVHPLAQVTRTALHRVVSQGAAARELLARLA